jgi:hypothetical protein
MGYPSTEAIDLASTLERALNSASSGLNSAATELGAEAVAVLLVAGSQVDITYFWSRYGHAVPDRQFEGSQRNDHRAVSFRSGLAEAGSSSAEFLREAISPNSKSFLLFPWQIRQRLVNVVFCFPTTPPYHEVTDAVKDSLNLVGLATWSVKEVARLNTELQTVNSRLAGRKLVERAKGMLQAERGFSEEEAYGYLRGESRKRRIGLAAVAEEVVKESVRQKESRSPAA